MPLRNRFRRLAGRRRKRNIQAKNIRRKIFGKPKMKNIMNQIVTFPSYNQSVFPRRLRCKLFAEATGYFAAAAATGSGAIAANQLYTPFNVTGSFAHINYPGGLAMATYSPIGLAQLYGFASNTPYNAYRVLASKIEMEISPQSVLDTCEIAIYPADTNAASITTVDTAMNQPFAKHMILYNGEKKARIVNYCSTANFYGVTKQAIDNDLSGNFDVFAAAANTGVVRLWTWEVLLKHIDNSNLSQNVPFSIKVTYYAEFWSQAYTKSTMVNPT